MVAGDLRPVATDSIIPESNTDHGHAQDYSLAAAAGFALVATQPALAAETGIGKPVVTDGLILRPVYLQPVHMAPELPGMGHGPFDAHLELDVHADKNNPQGFDPGAWMPYLTSAIICRRSAATGPQWAR